MDWTSVSKRVVTVRVPATAGNFGGAINCAAVALDTSLNVKITPRIDGGVGFRYFGEDGERVPRDRSNLVVRGIEAALRFRGREFAGADFEVYSSIPVGVGLGSSTAAVWAGLVAADRLFHLEIDEKALFELAAVYESRCDNLRAAWFGGFVACGPEDALLAYRRAEIPGEVLLSVVIPANGRGANPRAGVGKRPRFRWARKDFSVHFDRATAFAEFFAHPSGDISLQLATPLPASAGRLMPGLDEALKVQAPGLLSVFVCGSGPGVGILAQGDPAAPVEAVRECFARHGLSSRALKLRPSNAGAKQWNSGLVDKPLAPIGTFAPQVRKPSLIPI